MTDAELIESARMVGPDNVGMLPRLDLIIQDLADALERHQGPGPAPERPDYTDFRIENLWVFTQIGEDGEEGVVGFRSGSVMMPMTAADPLRFAQLQTMAKRIATSTDRPIHVSRFDTRVHLNSIEP